MSYPFEVMDAAAIAEFLAAARHALVATNRAGRSPQLSPVWYLYDDNALYFAVLASSAKYRNLIRDPQVSVCVDGGHPDARAVIFYGRAKIVGNSDSSGDELQWRIARRYMNSDEETRRYMEQAHDSGKVAVFVVIPDRVIARDYN